MLGKVFLKNLLGRYAMNPKWRNGFGGEYIFVTWIST